MRTCLKVSEAFGARLNRLRRTMQLAEAPFSERPTELADALRDARLEFDEALGDEAGDKPRLIGSERFGETRLTRCCHRCCHRA